MVSVCRPLNDDGEGTVFTGEVYVYVLLIMVDLLVTIVSLEQFDNYYMNSSCSLIKHNIFNLLTPNKISRFAFDQY